VTISINIEEKAKFFRTQGYVVVEDFFDDALMEHLDKVIVDFFGATPDFAHNDEFLDMAKTEVVPWFPQRENVTDFDVVQDDPRFVELTEAVLGEGWSSQYCMVMFSKQGTVGQAWHQDCPPEDPNVFNLNRLIYTSDITDEIGGQTLVVPGSHKKGMVPVGEPNGTLDDQIVLTPKKGTLVLLHGHTWHSVRPVKGPYRVSTNFRAAPEGTPDDVTDVAVYRNMLYRFSTSEVLEERTAT
jgi:ectoine hydroxylase-related dioxygenase (phytanoyl-CoA dioxygenase family)